MTLESLERRRVPIGVGLLLIAAWLASGVRRTTDGMGAAVLDSPLHLLTPRQLGAGWHLAPAGLLRISTYPVSPATYSFAIGAGGPSLVSREGIGLVAEGTIRYRVDPDRLLEVHRTLGPRFERTALAPWTLEVLRRSVADSSYSEISGARTESLREGLARTLGERFRGAGLVLLSCDVTGIRILASPGPAAAMGERIPGMKVLVIGLDGADWNVLDPLLQAGKLPNLDRLARTGVRGRLRTITPMLSPVVWTSIATGVLPARHGIIDFLASTPGDAEKVPVTSGLRKVKAIWNILSEAGVSVGVVAWWATYPAERVNGFIVSDRVAYQLFGAHVAADQSREGKVYPPDLDTLVASLTIAPESLALSDVSRYIRLASDPASLPDEQNKLIEDFKTLLAAGDSYARIGLALDQRLHPDFLGFYLEGTDTVAHLFMPYVAPALPGIDAAAAQRFGRTVDEYYRHADEIVGRFVEAADPGTAIIICSDHGFRTGENRPRTDSRIGYGQAADWHRKYGVLILNGRMFRRDHDLQEVSVLDIAPTVLALFGLPVAEDMDGRPILDGFDNEFLRAHPIRYVSSYEGTLQARGGAAVAAQGAQAGATPAAGTPVGPGAPGDQELKERLRSLGYLREDSGNSHNNRGVLLLAKGRYDEAIGEFRQAMQASEDAKIAGINIARAYYKKKDFESALRAIDEHLKRQPRSKEAENLLGNIAMEKGRMPEAETHFRKAIEYEPNFTDALNGLGILYDRQGRHEDALRQFQKVVEVDKDYAEAYNNIGVIYKNAGKIDRAIDQFKKAIAADMEFPGSYSNLALVYEDRGDFHAAEEQFRRALERAPDDAAVRTNYGALLYTEGRLEQAREELEKAVATDPSYASAHNNLGAVYGRLGRSQDEIAAYRKAAELDPAYADAHHNLGLALLKLNRIEEGEGEMRHALALDPRFAPAYINLGRSLLRRDRAGEAATLLGRGAREAPADPDIASLLGEALLKIGRRKEAEASLQRSLELKPDQPDLRIQLESLRSEQAPAQPAQSRQDR